jgi:Arc/MetJ family transcription regulator
LAATGGAAGAIPVRLRSALAILAWNVYNWLLRYTSMRTNIVIDDKLMRDTLRATGLKTKREAVDQALRTLLRLRKQAEIRRLRGKLDWQGDLNAMRSDS